MAATVFRPARAAAAGGGGGSVPTGSAGSPTASVVSVQGVSGGTGVPVTGTFWPATQPVSLASLPALVAGSATIGAVTQASGPWTMNLTQVDGTVLGAPANYGTSPGAVKVEGVNAYVTNTPAVSQSGTWTVQTSLQTSSHAHVTSLGTSLVVKASAGNLLGFYCNAITGGATGYCIAYNATSAPSTGALTGASVLDSCYFDGTAGGCSLSRIPTSIAASTGIVILLSSASTPFTYTTGTDTGFIAAEYQ